MVESESNGVGEFVGNRVSDIENKNVFTIITFGKEKIYSYDEALELTGHGKYNIGVLIILCLAINAMLMDLFGFSLVVNGASSDLQLEYSQKSLLLTIPLLGTIIMAYPWGYIADTQGRKKALLFALSGSFVSSALSAFSINWIMLAILKLLSSSCSGGIQSIAYTLMGELSTPKYKNIYILILSTVLMSGFSIYTRIYVFLLSIINGYLALRNDFSLNLGLITFTPWRLLALMLASTLGTTLLFFGLFHESPKFLLNVGRHEEALDVLRRMHKRNGECWDEYPVKKIVLNETCSFKKKGVSLIQSLKEQTIPLFKPPLLLRTLQLYYLIAVIYMSNNGIYLWLPFLAETFFESSSSPLPTVDLLSFNDTQSLCGMIHTSHGFQSSTEKNNYSSVNLETLWMALIQGVIFSICNLLITKVADRRKALMVGTLLVSSLSGAISVNVTGRLLSIIFFLGILLSFLSIGVAFSYFLDLYPTSYRGMASCLGMMVARTSGIASVHLMGVYIVPHCSASFYFLSITTFSGVVVSMFLPPDTKKV